MHQPTRSHARPTRALRTTLLRALAACLALVIGAAPVHAQDTPRQTQGGGVIDMGETALTGRRQKPEAFYVLQAEKLQKERVVREQSFLDGVVHSVNDEETF